MKKMTMMCAAALGLAASVYAGTTTIVAPPYGQAQVPVKAEAAGAVFTVKAETNAPVAWAAPIAVTQTAASVRISNVQINILPDAKINVNVAWLWSDAQGRPVRAGVTRYSEAEIAAKLQAKGTGIEQFRQLFLAIAAEEAVAP